MTRKRRRLLIIFGIAAAILAGLWLVYPRIDSRLIGSWVVKSPNGELRTFHLQADGHGTKDVISATWTGTVPFRWWVTSGRLVIHYRSDDAVSDTHDYVRSIVAKFTGTTAPREVQEYAIIDAGPESLTLKLTGAADSEEFVRLRMPASEASSDATVTRPESIQTPSQ